MSISCKDHDWAQNVREQPNWPLTSSYLTCRKSASRLKQQNKSVFFLHETIFSMCVKPAAPSWRSKPAFKIQPVPSSIYGVANMASKQGTKKKTKTAPAIIKLLTFSPLLPFIFPTLQFHINHLIVWSYSICSLCIFITPLSDSQNTLLASLLPSSHILCILIWAFCCKFTCLWWPKTSYLG